MTQKDSHSLLLLDGSGFIFRAFYALPAITREDGAQVGAAYGFTTMLMKLAAEHRHSRLAVVFDAARRNFRHDLYPQYKATRRATPPELLAQLPMIDAIVDAFGIARISAEGYEADDLIAAYAKAVAGTGVPVIVASGDKDLMQLATIPGVSIYDPIKSQEVSPAAIREKWGVEPDKLLDVMALAGDASDNVPGVPGIGIKTAAQMIGEFGSLDALLAGADSLPPSKRRDALTQHADLARLSRDLIRLADDAPLPVPVEDITLLAPDRDRIIGVLTEMRFASIVKKVDSWLAGFGLSLALTEQTISPVYAGDAAAASAARTETEYRLITSATQLAEILSQATAAGLVAVQGSEENRRLRGVSLAADGVGAWYLPLRHKTSILDHVARVDPEEAGHQLALLLADDSVLKVGHDIKRLLHLLPVSAPRAVDDIMVMAYALDSLRHGLALPAMAERLLGPPPRPKDGAGLEQEAWAADAVLRLYRLLCPRLLAEKKMSLYETFDRPLITILWNMERAGVMLDQRGLSELDGHLARSIHKLETDIFKAVERRFNIASPKQVGDLLFGEMGGEGGRATKGTGQFSTQSAALQRLAMAGMTVAGDILEWRHLSKLRGTYVEALRRAAAADGRVHTTFWQASTSTGRLSSSDPNLQNVPVRTADGRRFRQLFVAPPGRVLIGADYSQVELRVLAHVADARAMKQAFAQGLDIHAATAAQVFGVPLEQVTGDQRRQAKAINFGIVYGMSGVGLAEQLGISRHEGQKYIDGYLARYPEIKDFMARTKLFAHENGYVLTPFKRQCTIADIGSRQPVARASAERAAINAPIQGGAADIVKIAMGKIAAAIGSGRLRATMLLQVHDELLFEADAADAPQASAVIKEIMEGAVELSLPLIVDVKTGATWGDAH